MPYTRVLLVFYLYNGDQHYCERKEGITEGRTQNKNVFIGEKKSRSDDQDLIERKGENQILLNIGCASKVLKYMYDLANNSQISS